LSMQ